jgi:hypothetical protein
MGTHLRMRMQELLLLLVLSLFSGSAQAELITYTGAFGNTASAQFLILGGGGAQLQIVLTNTSTAVFIDGGANQVLSSINFDLGDGTTITGGAVSLTGGSSVVSNDGGGWSAIETPDLNELFGYSTTGIGKNGAGVILGALAAVTSHNNGGNAASAFDGGTGLPGGGLNYALVSQNSDPFGNSSFILDSVTIVLDLSNIIADLSFLEDGPRVEFGSDYAFVPNDPETPVIPEPATIALTGLGMAGGTLFRSIKKD